MARRGCSSRGSAGTLRRLAPRSAVYRPRRGVRRQPLCLVQCQGLYLLAVDPERRPVLGPDPSGALKMPAPEARQVCLSMRELGYDAEVELAPKGGG